MPCLHTAKEVFTRKGNKLLWILFDIANAIVWFLRKLINQKLSFSKNCVFQWTKITFLSRPRYLFSNFAATNSISLLRVLPHPTPTLKRRAIRQTLPMIHRYSVQGSTSLACCECRGFEWKRESEIGREEREKREKRGSPGSTLPEPLINPFPIGFLARSC